MNGEHRRAEDADVFLINTSDRDVGIRSLLKQLDLSDYRGKTVALKANFNSADPFPASTHIHTLEAIIGRLKEAGTVDVTLAERSGMGRTREVLEKLGVVNLSEKLGVKVVVLDELRIGGWTKVDAGGTHWLDGFYIPKLFLNAEKVVQTCCLKTHRFGGHFTMSLKNSIGLVARQVSGVVYDYMAELHSSPNQRLMIAEVNNFYKTDLVIMDAVKAFVREGPERGEVVEPNLLLAGRDRVAIDAVGIAILRCFGSTKEVMEQRIFELEQIRRAAELGVGVKSPTDIRLVSLDEKSTKIVADIEKTLKKDG